MKLDFNKKIMLVLAKIKAFFKLIFSKTKNNLLFFGKLCLYSLAYGIIVNYMLLGIFGIKFRLWSFPSYGILAYLIKEELPFLWHKFKG